MKRRPCSACVLAVRVLSVCLAVASFSPGYYANACSSANSLSIPESCVGRDENGIVYRVRLRGHEFNNDHVRLLRSASFLNLQELIVISDNVTSASLEILADLSELKRLQLIGSGITDERTEHILACQNLTSLSLAFSEVTDAGIADITRFRRLKMLDLNGTSVTDEGLVHLHNLRHLEILGLGWTDVTDAGLQSLANLPELREVILTSTSVSSDGLRNLIPCRKLERLELCETEFTFDSLESLEQMPALREVRLARFALTEGQRDIFDARLPHVTFPSSYPESSSE